MANTTTIGRLRPIVFLALLALMLPPGRWPTTEALPQWPFGLGSSSTSSSSSSSTSSSSSGPSSTTTTTTSQTTTITTSLSSGTPSLATNSIRLRSNRLRRPESCRESLALKSDELPELVITAKVVEVFLSATNNQTDPTGQMQTLTSLLYDPTATTSNRALVTVGRVIKGNKQLLGTDILVSGFNSTSSKPCPNYVKPNDTLILMLDHVADRQYSIQGGQLLPMNLANLDRINAIASNEPLKRRGPISDILCEAKYCPFGRCVVLNESSSEVACKCPDSCPSLPQPVCGSDNETYTNECHLIKQGCARQRPLFVTKESSC